MIIGQENLIKNVKNIMKIFKTSNGNITPHFFLTGGSGTGKTFTIKSLANEYDFGFIEINAASLTKEGTSGNSVSKALEPLRRRNNKLTIIFVDEFDKLFISGNNNSALAHEVTNGVQNEFLKALESGGIQVISDYGHYETVDMSKILFIFAGAFNGEENIDLERLRELGVKTEFLGRVPLIYNSNQLHLDDMLKILNESRLLNAYLHIYEDIDRNDVIIDISKYIKENIENNTLGARLINILIHRWFVEGGKLEAKNLEKRQPIVNSKLKIDREYNG